MGETNDRLSETFQTSRPDLNLSRPLAMTAFSFQPCNKKALGLHQGLFEFGRGSRIRTDDHQSPRLVRYQAALYPEKDGHYSR